MNYDVKMMLSIYGTSEFDWLGDIVTDVNKLTRHHIVKKENGGENGISNYALLTPKSHHLVNMLEEQEPEVFEQINAMFLELNRSIQPPTQAYYDKIKKILKVNNIGLYQRRK